MIDTPLTPMTVRQLRANVRQMQTIVKWQEQRWQALGSELQALSTEPALDVRVRTLGEKMRASNFDPAMRADAALLRQMFTGSFAGPALAKTVNRMLAFADHDLGHLIMDFTVQLPFHLKKRGLTELERAAVDRTIKNMPDYLSFRHYPDRLILAFSRQAAHLQPVIQQFDLEQAVSLAGLSCALRSVIHQMDFAVEQYDAQKCSDAHFTGVLMSIESGLKIKTIEPYLSAILYNLLKNTFKVALWKEAGDNSGIGTKVIVHARTHETYPEIAVIEVIDNGPGFDLKTIAEQALKIVSGAGDYGQMPAQVVDALKRLNGSPYAYTLTLNELMRTVFLYRLSTHASGEGTFSSGMGLYGASLLANQLQMRFVVGMNHAGTLPFAGGARFMMFLPKHPHAFMPDINLLAENMAYGNPSSSYFQG